jgi:hypothetical protein
MTEVYIRIPLVNKTRGITFNQYPIQDVAPSAVRIADAMDAISCTINLVVSFLFIIYPFFV